jgi:hypothetical protein
MTLCHLARARNQAHDLLFVVRDEVFAQRNVRLIVLFVGVLKSVELFKLLAKLMVKCAESGIRQNL